jgi:hypothetical protein
MAELNESHQTNPAILILTKRYASSENAGIVMTSEKAKRARTVERAGFV